MTFPWLFEGSPEALAAGEVTVLEGTTFCISDQVGNMASHRAQGLFVRDTRMISSWELTVDQKPLESLTVHNEHPHEGVFVSSVRRDLVGTAVDLLVVRRRYVGDGMREEIAVRNTSGAPSDLTLALRVGADFADIFEVKEGRVQSEERAVERGPDHFALELEHGDRTYAVELLPDVPATLRSGALQWQIRLPGHGVWTTSLEVTPWVQGQRLRIHHPLGEPATETAPIHRRRAWRNNVARFETADDATARVIRQSIEDLATLGIHDPERPELPVVAAGAPWFMALFGRDALLSSIMMLPLGDTLARGTLATLALHQGAQVDEQSEEEPGRILHELRFGPSGTLALGGRRAYFGTVDATPLFVVLLGELLRWSGPDVLTPDLVTRADRALTWMTTWGDPDGDGFIEYHRKTDRGLANQGWKDSWDGVNFADGRIAQAPIAMAEVQGYAYAAFRARAAVAHALGDRETAEEWGSRAARLKSSFNEAFWLPDRGWYAAGLDRTKQPIDALTSNNGHLLWSGIADRDKAETVAEALLSEEMFSGWGIRTLSTAMGAYNPMSYHNGSVWPHDTAICVGGLARYGLAAQAGRVVLGMLDAATLFGDRLPELFAGFARSEIDIPVPYPAACAPQAWAAAAPVELLRALIGVEPEGGRLVCDPVVPDRLLPIRLQDLLCHGQRHTLDIDLEGWHLV